MCNWSNWGRLSSALLAAIVLSIPACGSVSSLPVRAGGAGGLLLERDLDALPGWQQTQFTSPGWDAAVPPEADWLPAPAQDQVAKATAALLAAPPRIEPRGWPSADRAASWDGDQNWPPLTYVAQGEYESLAPGATPPFGCNTDASNSASGHAIEDVIAAYPETLLPQQLTYVLSGWSIPNYFNASGGTGKDALSSVYQLFSTDRSANPKDENSPAQFAELSYRADLAPGVGPGGDCSAAQAFPVRSMFWRAFNREFTLDAGMAETQLFNVLIAPSGELSDFQLNDSGTVGRFQPFYCGSLPECFGGGWLVGLDSSCSGCTEFNVLLAEHSSRLDQFFINPVLGVILKRWQQGVEPGAEPWDGALGWPVYGPVGYRSLEPQLNAQGAYRAIGMWFERGFIWWIDYDQALYPDAADEAQTYFYTGTHVYCTEGQGEYVKLGSTLRYSDRGPLGVCVTAEAMPFDSGTTYRVAVGETLKLHAHGYGGTPDAQWRYQYLTWRFGDGTVLPDTQAYVDDTQFVEHSFSEPGTYIVQVRVTDSLGAEAFGQALPVLVE